MSLAVGTRVEIEAKSTESSRRAGVIQEVLRGDPHPRYRIAWDDGHESIYSPSDGALHPAERAGGRR